MAMRDIASRARRRPKALGSRRSGRVDEPPEGVGKPRRCPTSPAACLLPGGSPRRSLWVIIGAPWYKGHYRSTSKCCRRLCVIAAVFPYPLSQQTGPGLVPQNCGGAFFWCRPPIRNLTRRLPGESGTIPAALGHTRQTACVGGNRQCGSAGFGRGSSVFLRPTGGIHD